MATFDADEAANAVAGHLISARKRARDRMQARLATARQEERRRIARSLTEEPLRAMKAVRSRLEELDGEMNRSNVDHQWDMLRRDMDEVCRTLERLVADLERTRGVSIRSGSRPEQLPRQVTQAPGSTVELL